MNQNTIPVEQSASRPAKEKAAERWRKLIDQQRESGLPVSAYCRERGLSAASMFCWRRRLSQSAATFKPVKVVSVAKRPARDVGEQPEDAIELPAASFVELCLRGGRRLILRRGFDRQLLLDVISALELRP
jgi:hypothetical protein